jgi:cell division protein FtsB
MINLYEGNGYTKYVLRSGLELTLHEDDFKEMLGFKDEMAQVKVRCNKLEKEIYKLVDENIELEGEIKKLKGVLI